MTQDWFAGEPEQGDDFRGEVIEFAEVDGKFGPQVLIKTKLDDPIAKNDGTLINELTKFYPLPPGWSLRTGTLTHDSGDPEKRMRANSKLQKVIGAAGDSPAGRAYLCRQGMNPYMADAWISSRWHWQTIEAGQAYKLKDKDTGEEKEGKTRGFPAPVEYLGDAAPVVGGVDAASVLGPIGLDEVTFTALTALAMSETAEKFIEQAIPLIQNGATNKSAGMAATGNGTLYEALREPY